MCQWFQEHDEGVWWTDCGNAFVFEDGGPIQNGFKFCGYCGKQLEENKEHEPEPERDEDN